MRKPPELGRDLAKSRHDQASPCPERLEKVIGVRVCAEEVSNIHQVPRVGWVGKKKILQLGSEPVETDHETT